MSIMLIGILIGVVGLIVMVFLLSLIKKDGPFKDLGVNIKRTHCPKCNEKQPIMRKPANQRQALFGGYTCKNCGVEMDKYGTEVDSDSN